MGRGREGRGEGRRGLGGREGDRERVKGRGREGRRDGGRKGEREGGKEGGLWRERTVGRGNKAPLREQTVYPGKEWSV